MSVRLTSQRKENVLGALLSLAEGGYGLQIHDGDSTPVAAVATRLFADVKVEVCGADIREGQTVGMARRPPR